MCLILINKVSSDFKGLKILSFLGNWHVCKRDAEKRGASAVCKSRRKCHLKTDTWLVMEKTALRSGLTLVLPSRVPHPPAEWWCKPHRGWPLTDGRHSWSQVLHHHSQILHHRSQILHPCVCCFLIEKAGWKEVWVIPSDSHDGWVSSLGKNTAGRAQTQTSPGSSGFQVCGGYVGGAYLQTLHSSSAVSKCLTQDQGCAGYLAASPRVTTCLDEQAWTAPPTQSPLAHGSP